MMDPDPMDDMMFLCAEDGSLALTGRELRERKNSPRGGSASPVTTAGRVLHAWDVTNRDGSPAFREYTTTQGYLVSDNEVVAFGEAFAEVRPRSELITADRIHSRVRAAKEETSFSGLKRTYSDDDLKFLSENASGLASAVNDMFDINVSTMFTGAWEGTRPYLVGTDHQYRIPLSGEDSPFNFQDEFVNTVSNVDMISNRQARLLWEATNPELVVDLNLYIEGELVS